MSGTERDREIREIEHDLTNLQRRYATLDRAANRARIASYVFIAALGALILAGAVLGKPAVSVTFAVVLIVVLLTAWSTARMNPELRWIDYVGWSPEGLIKQTEAMAVEHMIAERLQRLAKLRENNE